MKTIIKRNLDLSIHYTLIDKKYIPIIESFGTCCDNCGKLISNIATVKSDKGTYNIGFDCLETILINNQLLSGKDIAEYEKVKKMIPKFIRFSKTVKEVKDKYRDVTGLSFEIPRYESDFYTFYWLLNGNTTSRNNDYVKLKDIDFNFFLETLKNIFPQLDILTQ